MHFIQFTDKQHAQVCVQRYEAADMEELFNVHQRLWLSEGKIVELGEHVEIVDLQAFYTANK